MKNFDELFPGLNFKDCKPAKAWTREDDLRELEAMEIELVELRKLVFRKRKELGVER
jgi:hypothetical protein